MKHTSIRFFLTSVILVGLIFSSNNTFAQKGEKLEKKKARMSLSFTRNANDVTTVQVKVSHREGKKNVSAHNTEVELFINEISPSNSIGKASTDEKGYARFSMNDLFESINDTSTNYTFYAELLENEIYKYKKSSLDIREAKLALELYEEDSIRYIKANVQHFENDTLKNTADTEVKFYIQRTFSLLPFGGDYTYTDEEGNVIIEFPTDLPGDESGNLEIVVKLLEHEEFGTIEKRRIMKWGIPLVIDNSNLKQKLWSTQKNAPTALVVATLLIILGIWGTIFYLIGRLLKIKKLSKK